ncbi:MAG TPA: ABC transporter substrate-binding protein [Trueperaceae bacterium]|nr:ABC transporter substrate-binding protein [Trueperaceae bacterium]
MIEVSTAASTGPGRRLRRPAAWLGGALAALLALGTALAQPYQEAPMLAELVAAGELPPVEERLPEEPLVIEPFEGIGTYGGVIRRGFTGPGDHNNYTRWAYDSLLRFSVDGSEIVPHIIRAWEPSEDFHTWTLHLRPGMKWSDGHPFTADALLFYYEAVLQNEELTPSVPVWIANHDGTLAAMRAIDDYTVEVEFDFPYTLFPMELTFRDGGDRTLAAHLPGHYLAQFHPDYGDPEEIARMVSEAGLNDWTQLFMQKGIITDNPERPSTAAWVPYRSSVSDQVFTLRRNPYYFAVDPAGNQLPYVDEIQFRFFADVEALNFAAVAGELDMQDRHIQLTNYPVLVENAERSGYRVITWPTFGGNDAALWVNQQYTIDPELGELLANRDFRIALSIGIDREEIREAAFLGLGEIRQPVAAPWHPYYPGDEYAFQHTEFDPERANEILDGLGLQRGPNGMRTLPSGAPLRLEISVVPAFGPWPDVAQLIASDFADLGLTTDVQVRERTAHFTMRDANELIMEIWNEDTSGFPFTGNPKIDPRSDPATIFAVESRTWYATDGERGREPTPEIARIVEIIEEAKTVGTDRQIELAQELNRLVADQLYGIGTVGLTPMIQGVVVVNANLANVPDLVANDWPLRTPGDARPETFFYR